MKSQQKFWSFFVVILVLLSLFAFATMILVPSSKAPTNFKNISGTIALNATNASATGGNRTNHVRNVTWSWENTTTNRVIFNTTVFNTSVNQTTFTNSSFDTSLLADGRYNVTVTWYNHTHGSNFTEVVNVTVDNTVPEVTALVPKADQIFDNNTGNVSFGARVLDSLTGVLNVTIAFNNASGKDFNWTAANSSGAWNVSYNASALASGVHTITIRAYDYAGSLNSSETRTFTRNNAHNVTIFGLTSSQKKNFTTNAGNQTFNVSVVNASVQDKVDTVLLMFDNASGTGFNVSLVAVDRGQFYTGSYDVTTLAEGDHVVTVFSNDSRRNINKTETITFTVDTTDPTVEVTCSPSSVNKGAEVQCSCKGDDGGSGVKSTTFTGTLPSTSSVGTQESDSCTVGDHAGNNVTGTGTFTVTSSGGSGGSGGGSSGGVSSGVTGQFEKKVWTSILAGETASVEIANGAIGVTEISFPVTKTVHGPWISVKKRDTLPSSTDDFDGDVYSIIDITKGISLKDDAMGTVTLSFKVENSWFNDNPDVKRSQVALYRYADDAWTQLTTTLGETDGTYTHYVATTPGFSIFVIGQASPDAEVAVEAAVEEAAAEEPVAEAAAEAEEAPAADAPVEDESGMPTWLWVVIALVILVVIGWVWMQKSQK